MGASCSGSWQWAQRAGRCSTTASGVATSRSVSPRWPSCPPAFLPLRLRRLFVLLGLRPNPSLEGGFELVWLSLASRACSVCSCTDKASTCARSAGSSLTCARSLALSACRPAFSASSSAIRAASVMRLCYARYASPPDLLPESFSMLQRSYGMEPLLTTEDVATILRVDAVTVRRMVQRGELDAYRVAGEYRFSTDLLQAYLARQRLSRPGASTDLTSPFSRLAPAASEVLGQAQSDAHALGHDYLGTEHVLLSLLTLQTGAASRALEAVGVSPSTARTHLLPLLGPPPDAPAPCCHQPAADGALKVMPRLKQALERAARGAQGEAPLPEHLLLGLLADREALAVRVLLALRVSPEDLARPLRDQAWHDATSP